VGFSTQQHIMEDEMAEPQKKNIFDQVINAVTHRDDKAAADAAEAARLEAAAKAEAQARANMAAQAKTAADAKAATEAQAKAAADAAAKAAADAQAKAAATAQMVAEAQHKAELLREQAAQKAADDARVAAENAARAALPKHVVAPNDTLSAIAQKFYGHAAEPYWRLIYEANKAAIGANPGVIRPGTELVIPVLPDELKK
jgi:nucleoid-associated protein YgaU